MVGIDGRFLRFVELLDEGKNKAGVALQLTDKSAAAGGDKLRRLGFSKQAAVFKGIADLFVQFLPIRQDHDGRGACKPAADLWDRNTME